ncbi:hypothetical protein IFM89_015902 [Coptis chinensis]|uniref:FBD domain-containing protein n=1 Tax=Coptis chinensis TaxID=261450 RepID=A0A835HV18_9MAGN|nr:hypothetical protein IFM89_015902 [Coptis chinensis]
MIRHLTTNCPLLGDLTLDSCNKFSDLIIDIANPNITSLDIFEFYGTKADTAIEICAPNLQSLGFHCYLPRVQYRVKDALSLVTASFSFDSESLNLDFVYDKDDCEYYLVELLGNLCHVKHLRICRYLVQIWTCFYVLSIRGVQKYKLLSFDATCLKLETELTKWELPGISYLLKGSSNLHHLEISYPEFREEIKLSDDFKGAYAFEEKGFWESQKCDLAPVLQNLTHISFYFLSDTGQNANVAGCMGRLENKIEFVGFLFKNLQALESMVIAYGRNTEIRSKIMEMLTALPRVSPRIRIEVI